MKKKRRRRHHKKSKAANKPASPDATTTQTTPPVQATVFRKEQDRKPKLSLDDRKAQWKAKVVQGGEFQDEKFIDLLVDYASENHGYDKRRKAGATLLSMFRNLVYRCKNRMDSFDANDADELFKQLAKFRSEVKATFGENANQWRMCFGQYPEGKERDAAQRKAVDDFFDITGKRFSELTKVQKTLLQVRDAAWPSQWELEKGISSAYIERYIYLVQAFIELYTTVVTTSGNADPIFGSAYHQAASNYGNRDGGRFNRPGNRDGGDRSRKGARVPYWVKDGKCRCGSELTKDADGNVICSNPLCSHNIAPVFDDGQADQLSLPPAEIPVSTESRRDRKDHRHHSGDDEFEAHQRKSQKKGKPRGPRRINDDDDEGNEGFFRGQQPGEKTVYASSGNDKPLGSMADAFSGISIS